LRLPNEPVATGWPRYVRGEIGRSIVRSGAVDLEAMRSVRGCALSAAKPFWRTRRPRATIITSSTGVKKTDSARPAGLLEPVAGSLLEIRTTAPVIQLNGGNAAERH
jgi:hypothetical protein